MRKLNSPFDALTKTQLLGYLQKSEQSIENIIKEDDLEKAIILGGYDIYRFIT